MERDEFIGAIRTHGLRVADAADVAGLEAPVPSCPGWSVGDLVRHATTVVDFWAAIAAGDPADPADYVAAPAPADGDLVVSYRDGVERIASTLAPLEPAAPCWTWTDQQDIGFVQRRMAHELAVHGWDATNAAGAPEPIEPVLAVDGVDEYLDVFVPTKAGHADGSPFTAHLHATDTDGEWVVRMGDGTWSVERAHAKGDVAVRGTASDLLLALWGRIPYDSDRLEVFGEAGSVAELGRRLALG